MSTMSWLQYLAEATRVGKVLFFKMMHADIEVGIQVRISRRVAYPNACSVAAASIPVHGAILLEVYPAAEN